MFFFFNDTATTEIYTLSYTTLFRSARTGSDERRLAEQAAAVHSPVPARRRYGHPGSRSEEHTSELQSQSNLVCRLLLEKKKCTSSRARKSRTRSTAPTGGTSSRNSL